MRVVISAGGTGGHIYPALAIINKIKDLEPNSEFLYIGTHNRMEKDIVPKYNIPFKSIEIYGFNRKNLFKNFKTVKCLLTAKNKCKKIIITSSLPAEGKTTTTLNLATISLTIDNNLIWPSWSFNTTICINTLSHECIRQI